MASPDKGDPPAKSWPVRTAVSYGGLVVRSTGEGPEVALIRPRRQAGEKAAWALPKGAREEGETPEDAALREVREETGLEAEILEALEPITYWFGWAPEKVRYKKTVHFYLMRETGGDTSRHDHEVEEVRFFPLDEAAKLASYTSERKLIDQAKKLCQR